jgi:hypothetical protein
MAFLSLTDSLRILILILPPHTTHRLQSLGVGLEEEQRKAQEKREIKRRKVEEELRMHTRLVSDFKHHTTSTLKESWNHVREIHTTFLAAMDVLKIHICFVALERT